MTPFPTSTGGAGQEEKYEFLTESDGFLALGPCGICQKDDVCRVSEKDALYRRALAERDAALQVAAAFLFALTKAKPEVEQINTLEARQIAEEKAKRILSEAKLLSEKSAKGAESGGGKDA